jgi:uncharacterized membrane protein (DUF441 family)
VLVPVIIAIVQAIKLTGWVKDHYSPLLAIGVGIIISWLGDNNQNFSVILLNGAVYGLISSGLYSGVKTTMQARNRQKAQGENKKNNAKNRSPY